jgi:hypothetical protein
VSGRAKSVPPTTLTSTPPGRSRGHDRRCTYPPTRFKHQIHRFQHPLESLLADIDDVIRAEIGEQLSIDTVARRNS